MPGVRPGAGKRRASPTVYHLLLTRLIDANHGDLTDLRRAAKLRDWAGVHRSIHRLKGSAALARCPTLVAAGKSIESAAKYRKAAVVNALLPRYVAIVTEFNDRLRDLRSNALRAGRRQRSRNLIKPSIRRVQVPRHTGKL
jgi:HPt (histidine-containing phosphotransfer) domain-containing protein